MLGNGDAAASPDGGDHCEVSPDLGAFSCEILSLLGYSVYAWPCSLTCKYVHVMILRRRGNVPAMEMPLQVLWEILGSLP